MIWSIGPGTMPVCSMCLNHSATKAPCSDFDQNEIISVRQHLEVMRLTLIVSVLIRKYRSRNWKGLFNLLPRAS